MKRVLQPTACAACVNGANQQCGQNRNDFQSFLARLQVAPISAQHNEGLAALATALLAHHEAYVERSMRRLAADRSKGDIERTRLETYVSTVSLYLTRG